MNILKNINFGKAMTFDCIKDTIFRSENLNDQIKRERIIAFLRKILCPEYWREDNL